MEARGSGLPWNFWKTWGFKNESTSKNGILRLLFDLGICKTERDLTQGELINRENLAKSLVINQPLKNIQFLPEIWQGHKNKGEGFWFALEFLEMLGD